MSVFFYNKFSILNIASFLQATLLLLPYNLKQNSMSFKNLTKKEVQNINGGNTTELIPFFNPTDYGFYFNGENHQDIQRDVLPENYFYLIP